MKSLLPVSFYIIGCLFILSSCNSVGKVEDAPSISKVDNSAKRNFTIKLYNEKYSLNTFVSRYIPVINYHLSYIDSNNFRTTYNDSLNNLSILWRFGIENNYLTYYGFKFEECTLSKYCFDKFFSISDSLLSALTEHYGLPAKKTINEKNFYSPKSLPEYPGIIVEGIWIVDGQEIKVSFKAAGEHNMYSYTLDVSRSKPSNIDTK